MEQQKIIDELNYYRAQKITEMLYEQGMISFVEYDKLTELNRRSFSPMFADLLPKTLDKSIVWRCITRLTDKDKCRARTVNEDDLIAAFLAALNEMVGNSTEYLQRLKDNLETALKTANPESAEALAERMAELQQELIDRTERRERYDDLTEEILRLRELQAQTAIYVATVARTYRKAIDDYLEDPKKYEANMPWYKDQISNCTYRQFTTGFYFGKPSEESQIYDSNTYIREYTYLGIIGEIKDGLYRIEQRNKFSVGEVIEIMKPDGQNVEATVEKIIDEDGNEQESAPHPKQVLYVALSADASVYDILRRAEKETE